MIARVTLHEFSQLARCPKVSIGMPIYNGEDYLQEALRSLLTQTFSDFEIIISDNASTDASGDIATSAARRDSRIRYYRQPTNVGAIENFNWVFGAARGTFFKWAAHDDICQPTFLERCLAKLEATPDAVWCHCDTDQVDERNMSLFPRLAGQPTGRHRIEVVRRDNGSFVRVDHPRKHAASSKPHLRLDGVLRGTTWSVDSYGLIRTETLRSTRLLKPVFGGEKVLIGELALRGTYVHVEEILFAQRVHAGAASWSGNLQQQQAFTGATATRCMGGRLRLFYEHLVAILRAPHSIRERVRCLIVLAKYALQLNKWMNAATGVLKRRGIGGDAQVLASTEDTEACGS